MQPVERILLRVVEACDRLGLAYFVTGSIASMAYGEARFTQDVDIVIEIATDRIDDFCAAFPGPDYYVSVEAARDAAEHGAQFNIIWAVEGVKADIIVLKGRTFDGARLQRAKRLPLPGGGSAMFAAPEDVILSKLEFYREGGSDKHLRDIASMMKVSGAEIDRGYIESWAARLGVTEEWGAIKARLGLG